MPENQESYSDVLIRRAIRSTRATSSPMSFRRNCCIDRPEAGCMANAVTSRVNATVPNTWTNYIDEVAKTDIDLVITVRRRADERCFRQARWLLARRPQLLPKTVKPGPSK